ncbi:hypothetical protein BZL30_2738 [Mycobacterium kansasii]|uniref:Uncharacterized protein n=1 Tax=Mycobacterium kansasii TaxID=1768 RepID=A0A1V3XID3_MYCKA|nr:hypothetical protein BZL30_2738 [Mycobacterium kansasii]
MRHTAGAIASAPSRSDSARRRRARSRDFDHIRPPRPKGGAAVKVAPVSQASKR